MNIKPIKNQAEYQQALARLEEIFDTVPGTPEGDELEGLARRIEEYEKKHYQLNRQGLAKRKL